MRKIFWILVIALICGLGWIRFAPSDPAVWNTDPMAVADQDLANGLRRRLRVDQAAVDRLEEVILATPHTSLLVKTPGTVRSTFVTRTKWFGFPDYTTVQYQDGLLEIYARSRFGVSDLGVNRTRVEAWLAALRQ